MRIMHRHDQSNVDKVMFDRSSSAALGMKIGFDHQPQIVLKFYG